MGHETDITEQVTEICERAIESANGIEGMVLVAIVEGRIHVAYTSLDMHLRRTMLEHAHAALVA
jgi:hypothetical protein